jgi:CO/xanthine dehydrogenase FAD-binding subunit
MVSNPTMMVSKNEPHANELVRPADLASARAQLAADPSLRPLGGGTAIVPELRAGATPGRWLTTTSIAGLDGVSVEENGDLVIGAAARLRQIEMDPRVREGWPLLASAIAAVAGPAIRNAATIGGSLALGIDSPDPATALGALGARVSVTGSDHELGLDRVPTADGSRPSPLIETIRVPPRAGTGWDYQRFTVRGEADRPFVIVAALMTPTRTSVVAGVGRPRPVPLTVTAQAIEKRRDWRAALDADIARLRLPDSDRGSGAYRARVLRALAARAITAASASAGGP